jgi:hypothetical protein
MCSDRFEERRRPVASGHAAGIEERTMVARLFLTVVVCGSLGFGLAAQPDDPVPKTTSPAKLREDQILQEQILARQFAQFEQDLFKLILKLKRSAKEDDRLRAEVLEKVLDRAKKDLVSVQFEKIIEQLKEQQLKSTGDIKIAAERSEKLADHLRELIALLREDPRQTKNRDEQNRLKEIIAELEKIIHRQKVAQGLTDGNKTDKTELGKIQNQVTNQTAKLLKKLDAKGDPKEGGKDGKGEPKEGKGSEKTSKAGEPKPGSKGEGQPKEASQSPPGKPSPNQPQDPAQTGKKQIQEANEKQQSSEKNIAKDKNPDASKDQGEAIEKLEDAKKKLEDLLRQLREEEMERVLADLLRRCEKMLAMQIAVFNGTVNVAKAIAGNSDKLATRENKAEALKLSDQEGEIVVEAKKAIEVLEAEGSAVAFPEVFQQVREDMSHVQRRLGVSDVGEVTQTIEQDIIESLKEMIEALKKAKQDLNDKKNNPPPGPPPPPQDSKLLELIQELKLIRSLQIRVNTRTQTYGRMYQAKEGEQTADPGIRQELFNLSDRQERIFDVTNRLAKGDNR